ncbi:MAG: ABC transporter permease [Cohaesibacteraceae bacterium]|nr:ABC transporter permease [Cohaesibacteraceae bacterium]
MTVSSNDLSPVTQSAVARFLDSDIVYSFKQSKVTIVAAIVTLLMMCGAFFAPWITAQNPFDLATLDLMESLMPPVWMEGGEARFPLGTDGQGRDIFSVILYGSRLSLMVGFSSIILAGAVGISLGILAGYVGGRTDAIIMRIADVQLTFPSILIALLIDGTVHSLFPQLIREDSAFWVLVLSIGMSFWVQYARTVRGSTLVERNKEYVQAARVIGVSTFTIMVRHILPNVLGPVLVITTINLALAIILEATLSFLGVGIPPTQPSLGTLIRIGNDFLFSGEWWITFFPGAALATLALSVNLLGDWLRDALNPKLR